jgi:hypothetical protein
MGSPCIDAGEADFFTALVEGYPILQYLTTSRAGTMDTGNADLGFHNEIYTGHVKKNITITVDDWNSDGNGYGVVDYGFNSQTGGIIGTVGFDDSPKTLLVPVKYDSLLGNDGYNYNLGLWARPDAGFRVKSWLGTDNDSSFSVSNRATIDRDRNVIVDFEIIHQQDLHVPGMYSFTDLQRAIDDARTGDTIIIASGTYKATGYTIRGKGITIRGGSSDPNETIISGQDQTELGFLISGSDIVTIENLTISDIAYTPGTPVTFLRPAGDNGWNGGSAIGGAFQISGNHIISNCIIRDCRIVGGAGEAGTDGDINVGDDFPESANVPDGGDGGRAGNAMGAGIYVSWGSPQILNCEIDRCVAVGGTGAIGGNGDAGADIPGWGITFGGEGGGAGNAMGGGIYINSSWWGVPTIKDCVISNCGVQGGTGAVGGNGGVESTGGDGGVPGQALGAGIYIAGSGNVIVEGCSFIENIATGGRGGDGGLVAGLAGGAFGGGTYADPGQGDVRQYTTKGGGAYCDQGTQVTFKKCTFRENQTLGSISGLGSVSGAGHPWEPVENYQLPSYGAGVYSGVNSFVTITDSLFEGNITTIDEAHLVDPTLRYFRADQYIGYGGGVCIDGGAYVGIADSHLAGNQAPVGGAIYGARMVDFHVHDCDVVDNLAVLGGGIFTAETMLVEINNVNIKRNSAKPLFSMGSGIPVDQAVSFDNGYGGGLYIFTSEAFINDCVISENSTSGSGGGVYLSGHEESIVVPGTVTILGVTPELNNCLITNNTAVKGGGGLLCDWFVNATVSNCTIADNSSSSGFGGGVNAIYGSNVGITHSILWGNKATEGSQISVTGAGPVDSDYPSFVDVQWSDVQLETLEEEEEEEEDVLIDPDGPLIREGFDLQMLAANDDNNDPSMQISVPIGF